MPNYTLCVLLKADLTDGDREKFLQELPKNLPDSQKPEIISWGKRNLAYPILKETQAFYYLVKFEADGSVPGTLDKKLKVSDQVLRFLIVKRAKKEKVVRLLAEQKDEKLKTKIVKTKIKKKTVTKKVVKKSGKKTGR